MRKGGCGRNAYLNQSLSGSVPFRLNQPAHRMRVRYRSSPDTVAQAGTDRWICWRNNTSERPRRTHKETRRRQLTPRDTTQCLHPSAAARRHLSLEKSDFAAHASTQCTQSPYCPSHDPLPYMVQAQSVDAQRRRATVGGMRGPWPRSAPGTPRTLPASWRTRASPAEHTGGQRGVRWCAMEAHAASAPCTSHRWSASGLGSHPLPHSSGASCARVA